MRLWTPVARFDREGIDPSLIATTTRVPAPPLDAPVAPVERVGGLPVGFPAERWPVCEDWLWWGDDGDCLPMSFLGQFAHHPDRCDLGREGRWLFVFGCLRDDHPIWEREGGANACVVVEPEEMTTGETIVEGLLRENPQNPIDQYVHRALRIVEWEESDDGFSAAEQRDLRGYPSRWYESPLLERWIRLPRGWMHLGGTPAFSQGADSWPDAPWRYLGSLGWVTARQDPAPVFEPPVPGYEPFGIAPDGSWAGGWMIDGFEFALWADTSDPEHPRVQLMGWP